MNSSTVHCGTHHENPDPGCADCEPYFCADCSVLLTFENSGYGSDICTRCEIRQELDKEDS